MKYPKSHPWRQSIMTDCEAEKRRAAYLKGQTCVKVKGVLSRTVSMTQASLTDSQASPNDQPQNKD